MLRNISTVYNIHALKQRKCEYAFWSSTYKISFRSTILRIRKLFICGTPDKRSLRSDWHAVVCLARPSQRYNISYPPPKMLPRINNEQAENSCSVGSRFGAQQRGSPADTTVSSSGSTSSRHYAPSERGSYTSATPVLTNWTSIGNYQ